MVIKKTCSAYATITALIKAGRLQGKRADKATSKPVGFRLEAAQAFDDRCLSWQHDARTVSIWTVQGRMRGIAFTGHPDHLKAVASHRKGESNLVFRDGNWYLMATLELIDAETNTDPADFLGVDMGIVNIATTSDGDNYAGEGLRRYRQRMAKVRAELQAKATKSAKRKLKARARRESRAVKDNNHRIAKQLVAVAGRTGRGIGLEELTGIRDRVRLTAASEASSIRGHSTNSSFQGHFTIVTGDATEALSAKIVMYRSADIEGPYAGKTELYTTPETGGNVFTYNAKAHPNLGDNDTLVVSYNVNSFQGSDLYADARLYRPRYINVHF